ncbi:MAG: PEP-CTERM system TPR-repeat protein PrsT [Ideonella sp.]|nr:PEP-CTERM system TPR-repeat protein PrsT [Ideonella sp.]
MSRRCKTFETAAWKGRSLLLAAVVLACAAPVVHATPEKAAKFYEDALKRYEKEDLPGAVVQLKNTIQEDRKMLAAHLLLGKVLLRTGELKGAEAAFEEALRQGVSRTELAVSLAQLYLQLGEYKKLLDQVTPEALSPALQAEVLTARGTAFAMSGNPSSATKSFADARTAAPQSAAPLVAEIPMLLRAGERDKAKAMAIKATELAPKTPGSWYTLGSTLQTLQDSTGALAAYDRALSLEPKFAEARVGRATLLVGLRRDKEAEQELAALKAASVVDPRTSYMRALLANRKGDVAAAKAGYSEAVGMIDSAPPAWLAANEPLLMTGALSHRALGNLSKAREYLETLVARNGRHLAGMVLLASVYVDSREYGRALPLLESLQRAIPDDPHVLFLLGSVQLARKHYVQASELFEKSAARNGASDAVRELGFSQLGLGQDKLGLANLERAFASNPNDTRAGVQLATIYAQQGQSAKALQTAEAIVKLDPANLTMLNFLGNVKGRLGDKAGARAAFQQVLAKDPAFRPVVINLSWLDMEEGRLDDARNRLNQALAQTKDDPDMLFELGALEQRAKHPAEALRHWTRADEIQRQDFRPGLAIADLLGSQTQYDKALEAAKLLASKYPSQLLVQLALGRAYSAVGDMANTRQTLQEATRLAEFDADKQVAIGRMQLMAANPDGAAYNLVKALQARPDHLGALVLQVELEARRGDAAKTDAALKALNAKHGGSIPALLTTANVAMSRGQFSVAQTNYQAAMDREPSTPAALMLARAQIATGDTKKAVGMLESWSRKRPDDRVALKALAEVQLQNGQHDAARKSYNRVLAAEPDDAQSLSSYAVLLQQLNDPAAVPTAEKALKLAPGNPDFADVLGWILVQRGSTELGLRHLREARLRAPANGEIRYHLAVALAKTGRTSEAKQELSTALTGPTRVQRSEGVDRLKAELGL